MLAQLTLRQEDAINVLRMDRGFLLLFKTAGQETVVHTLFEIATAWRQKKANNQVDLPLRVALLKSLVLEMKTRLEHLVSTQGQVEKLQKLGWVKVNEGRPPSWLPLVYNQETKTETAHPTLGCLEHEDLMKALDTLQMHMNGQIMQRFHSTRPLAAQYKGEMLAFMLEISLRGPEEQKVHEALVSLCHVSAWFSIGARLRMETPKRSPLANRLQKMLPKPYRAWFCKTRTTIATSTSQYLHGCGQ